MRSVNSPSKFTVPFILVFRVTNLPGFTENNLFFRALASSSVNAILPEVAPLE